jgi:hypothetical protein
LENSGRRARLQFVVAEEALFCEAFDAGRAIARGGEGGLGSATLACDSEITMAATPGPQPGPGGHEQGHEHEQLHPRRHAHTSTCAAGLPVCSVGRFTCVREKNRGNKSKVGKCATEGACRQVITTLYTTRRYQIDGFG